MMQDLILGKRMDVWRLGLDMREMNGMDLTTFGPCDAVQCVTLYLFALLLLDLFVADDGWY